MIRNGTTCALCSSELHDWQEDEYNVLPGMCPECTLQVEDYGDSDLYDAIENGEIVF